MNISHSLLLATFAFAGSAFAGSAPAKNPVPPPPAPAGSGWWFRTAAYGWVTAIEGDVGIGRLSAPVDISMSDTLDTLDMAAMGIFEGGYGRWSLGLDFIYGKTSDDFAAGGRLFDSFRFEQKQWILTPFAACRLIETERYRMDVFAGARITVLEAELTGRLTGPGEVKAESDVDWVDPIIGIRGQAELGGNWFFRYNADVGGFGASSDLTWQAIAGLGYHFNDHLSTAIGYRALGVDYDEGEFSMDTVSHGPVIGLEVRW